MSLGRRAQTAIFCAAVAAGGLAYGIDAVTAWHRRDITPILKADLPMVPFPWSDDGRKVLVNWLADYARDEAAQQVVADLSAGTATVLPPHKGAFVTARPAPGCVVRSVRARGDEKRQLFLYRLADGREALLSGNVTDYPAMFGPSVSPTGKAVCWLETAETPLLKVYDVTTGRTRTVNVAWPTATGLEWQEALWIDGQTLGVVGSGPEREEDQKHRYSRLHTLRIHIPDLTMQHLIAPGEFRGWRPAPDLTSAFAVARQGHEDVVYYVDLRTGRVQPMGGEEKPVWTPDGKRAFRVINRAPNKPWLMAFDPATSTETPLLKIPGGFRLVDVSPRGRFALLKRDGWRLRPLVVVDVASGRRHALNTPGSALLTGIMMDFHWRERLLGTSFWSPDGRRLTIPSFWLDGRRTTMRTWLYTVPDDWP